MIPPVLQLMLTGFGFDGMEGAGPDALAAPQAVLMSSVATGIFDDSLNWNLIFLGAAIGSVVIIIDEILTATTDKKYSLPPLAVGMGMYLPVSVTVMVPIGAAIGHFYNRWASHQRNPESAIRMGTLGATGLIVGESLFGVVNAGIIAAAQGESPLEIFEESSWTTLVGVVLFVAAIAFIYKRTAKAAKDLPITAPADAAAAAERAGTVDSTK